MRASLLIAVLLGLASSLAFADPGPIQRTISFQVEGLKVVGTLELPDRVKSPPVILMLHGFPGSRDELTIPSVKQGIFARAADAWAAKGFASLRIDCRGIGDSGGDFADTSLSGQIEDALAAVEFLHAEKSVDASRLFVMGWSNGGAVAAAVAGRSRRPIRAVALWAPVAVPSKSLTDALGSDYVKAGLASGGKAVTETLASGQQFTLKTRFFEDLFRIDPVAEFAHYPGPVLVVVGTRDASVTPQPAMGQLFLTYHRGPGELSVRPMDHAFNVFENAATVDDVIAATIAFLGKYAK